MKIRATNSLIALIKALYVAMSHNSFTHSLQCSSSNFQMCMRKEILTARLRRKVHWENRRQRRRELAMKFDLSSKPNEDDTQSESVLGADKDDDAAAELEGAHMCL